MNWEKEGGAQSSAPSGKKKGAGKLIAAIVVVLVLIFGISRCLANQPQPLSWPTTGLATKLPKPKATKGEIHSNSDTSFLADAEEVSRADYDDYVAECVEKGFTLEAEINTTSYTAFSDDGHELRLSYYESKKEMSINLDAPTQMGTLTWPASGPGSLVPAPSSTTGKVTNDSSSRYVAKVGDTTPEAYSAYVDACIAAGFDIDYSRGDTMFRADNADGAHVSVSYEGANVMSVAVDAPEEGEAATTPDPEPAPETEAPATSEPSTSDSADFKAVMDGYEAFMDEYIDFMTTYNESDNVVAMMADYASMMARYHEYVTKIDDIDEDSLSASDLAYYLEVTNRVNQKLVEAAV